MTEDEDGDYPTPDEQHAFSEAHDLIRRLIEADNLSAVDVGNGFLVAALSCLRKALPETEVSLLLFKYADDYATRHLDRDP